MRRSNRPETAPESGKARSRDALIGLRAFAYACQDYEDQPEEAVDYSVIGSFAPPQACGKCVYCNHCKPCPAGIDIGLVNKYYDLAKAGDPLAVEHYKTLEKNAADCIRCGHCDSHCPFSVRQSERMQEIRSFMESRYLV